ncbi:Transcriptional regulatory protein ZraR [Maioricimonas rarisocia]|uniref:DNA-binding transcriptional regulator NtrC n=1 Tax=Maioricimonas rarisocia TaxID=2528026 RepID=A0A517Z611_9PLAN|nr:sigma-54 dependent transcriptional regulator [Maioricimonas rarisocia]QDU37940.1 Transcriptional regulatory protein ZraR [Maioricimonas rarisocia]
MSHVLIVDDEPGICWGFRELLTDDGHQVSVASSAEAALELAETTVPDAVLLDVRLPGMDGLAALEHLRARIGSAPVIVMTAFGNLETACRAVDAGAFDYLTKPFDLEEATAVLQRALASVTAPQRRTADLESASGEGPLIGRSPAMQEVFKQIAVVARGDVPVLVTGESGTGKELVSRAIHDHGPRRSEPYVPVFLAALSPSVIESELFGHAKGAFTGADHDRRGLLELAGNGTVFLDEIGDVPLDVQVKLLRAIEHQEVVPVGSVRPRPTGFRVVAATHRSIPDLIAAGTFREDLFFRLNVFHIVVPPLRDRRDDIPLLAGHFLRQLDRGDSQRQFTDRAMQELRERPWHGNVRELRNAVERAAVIARGPWIDRDHLPPPMLTTGTQAGTNGDRLQQLVTEWTRTALDQPALGTDGDEQGTYERFLEEVEPALLRTVLEECDGNRAAAARQLGMHRSTLRQKLRRYGLD